MSSSNSSVQALTENYINNMMTQYNDEMDLFNQIQKLGKKETGDNTRLSDLQHELHEITSTSHTGYSPYGPTKWSPPTATYDTVTGEINKVNGKIADVQSSINLDEQNLQALDPGMVSLDNLLNEVLSIQTTDGSPDSGLVLYASENVNATMQYINQIFAAMQTEAQANKDQNEIKNGSKNGLSNQELEQLAAQRIGLDGTIQSDISSLQSSLVSNIQAYNAAYNVADIDSHRYNFFEELFEGGYAAEARDARVEANATAMQQALSNIMKALAPLMGEEVNEVFSSIQTALKAIFKKLEEILANPDLSSSAKQKKILVLMMFALGYFNLIQQEVETLKTQNEQKMSQANIDATKMNLGNTKAEMAIQQEVQENAKVMKLVQTVSTLVLGTVFTILSPGVGTAILMATLTTLEVTGAIGDMTRAIAKKLQEDGLSKEDSQILADVIGGAIEVVATVGGGALLDVGLSSVCKAAETAAVDAAVQASKEAIEQAAKQMAEDAARLAGGVATTAEEDAAKVLITDVAEQAARNAAKMAAKQFLKQSLIRLVPGAIGGGLKAATEKAAKEAASLAIKDAVAVGMKATQPELDQIASQSSLRAVSNITGKSVKKLAQESVRTAGDLALRRSVFTSFGAIANTNMLIDSANAIQQADGKKLSDTQFEAVLATLQVVEQIMQAIAIMLGGGFLEQAEFEQNSTLLSAAQKGLTATQSMSLLASSASSYGIAQTQEVQGGVTKDLQMTTAIATVLHAFLDEIQKDANKARASFMEQIAAEIKSQVSMSAHLHDGELSGINVLVSGAV